MGRKAAVVISLAALALVDALWALDSGRASPLIGSVAFAVVAILVGIRSEFRAGLIVGIAGVAIHLLELVFHGLRGLGVLEASLFAANLCLSVVVAVYSWSALRSAAVFRSTKEPRSGAQAT
jgi:hypothetical protein